MELKGSQNNGFPFLIDDYDGFHIYIYLNRFYHQFIFSNFGLNLLFSLFLK